MARVIGALALVVSCGLFVPVQARPAHYEYVMSPYMVTAMRLLPPAASGPGAMRPFALPLCQSDVCDSNVLCAADACSPC